MTDSDETSDFEGRDIDVQLLKPLRPRTINFSANRGYLRILASVKYCGLIHPLCVYPEGDHFWILDGYLRYVACKQLGAKTLPCLIQREKEAYTYNRHVNPLTGSQEIRMLHKARETAGTKAIAAALGLANIQYRLAPSLAKLLHPSVLSAFNKDVITRTCALEFTNVLPARQVEMLADMKRVDDYSATFCRALIIQTDAGRRTKRQVRKAWAEDDARKRNMLGRLQHAEKQHAFYSQLYRQYSTDLMKMVFFVRKMMANSKVESFLKTNHPEILERLRSVVGEIA